MPEQEKSAEEEVTPKKRAVKRAGKGSAPAENAVSCSYSKRIGDAPPLPTAETHGPVVEKAATKSGIQVRCKEGREEERQEGIAAGVGE